MLGKIHIGTSGWHYKHWIGTFYPPETKSSEQLGHYIQHFKTVEINNSFYKLPSQETFANWKAAVPEDFLFAVKGSRYITHMKKLKDPNLSTPLFFKSADVLEEKLGPILFQLPPWWTINAERLQSFVKQLPKGYLYTFEFRNPTWYTEQVFDILKEHNCAFCIYELNKHTSPAEITADFVYVRLHGPDGKYAGSYPEEILSNWAVQCNTWAKTLKNVFVYFDNDQMGYAPFNAKHLHELVTMPNASPS